MTPEIKFGDERDCRFCRIEKLKTMPCQLKMAEKYIEEHPEHEAIFKTNICVFKHYGCPYAKEV